MLERKFDYQDLINWTLKEQSNRSEEILILGIPDNLDNLASILKIEKHIKIITYKNFDLNEFCFNYQIENIEEVSIFQELVSLNDDTVNWYTYNDERKNGILNLSEKNIDNQNLKLISIEEISSLSLINILKKYRIENKKILLFLFEDHLIKESLLEKIDFKNIVSIICWNKDKEYDDNIFGKNYSKKTVSASMLNIWEPNYEHLNTKIKDLNIKVKDLNIDNDRLNIEVKDLNNANDQLITKVKDLNYANDRLNIEVKDLNIANDQLIVKVNDLNNANDFLSKQNEDISIKNHNNLYSLKNLFPYERFLDLNENISNKLDDDEKIFEIYDSNRSKFEEYFKENSMKDYYQNLYRFTLFKLLSSNKKELSNIFTKRVINRQKESPRRFVKVIGTTKNIMENTEHNFAKKFTLYNYSNSTMCTFIPKNACTSLRYSFALANGFVRDLEDIDWIHGNNDSQQASENELRNCCYSFIILRSPFTRLSSYFLDKIVGNFGEGCITDESYKDTFLNKFCKVENLTFEKYINIIWENPNIIYKDLHTTPQIDFLLFDDYDKWIALEKLSKEINNVELKSGVKFIDTRNHVRNTTKGYELNSNEYHGDITVNKLRDLKRKKLLPAHETLFNEETSYKILISYLSDVFLYIEKTNSYNELKKYLDLSNKYIKKKS